MRNTKVASARPSKNLSTQPKTPKVRPLRRPSIAWEIVPVAMLSLPVVLELWRTRGCPKWLMQAAADIDRGREVWIALDSNGQMSRVNPRNIFRRNMTATVRTNTVAVDLTEPEVHWLSALARADKMTWQEMIRALIRDEYANRKEQP